MVWTISNLCRGTPKPDFLLVRDCIPAMTYAIAHEKSSDEARTDALWALSYLSDGEDFRIQAIVESGQVVPHAMTALKCEKASLMAPALRILGNIVTGNAEQTQVVLDAGILEIVPSLLENSRVRWLLHACPDLFYLIVTHDHHLFSSLCFAEDHSQGDSLATLQYRRRYKRSSIATLQAAQNCQHNDRSFALCPLGGSQGGNLVCFKLVLQWHCNAQASTNASRY